MTNNPPLKTPEEKFAEVLDAHIGCMKPYCFIRRADKEMIAPNSFNMGYNRIINTVEGLGVGKGAQYPDKAAQAAMAAPALEIVQTITYRPDAAPVIDGKFNMWTDPLIKPLKGEPTIFLEHMLYLIPNKAEREFLIQWLAWIVQHPDQKVMWAILIIGREGSGKSWLGVLMERLFGATNVALITEENAVIDKFNSFAENKRFIFLHETPPDEVEKLLNRVKGLITQDIINVRRMRNDYYNADNFANLMAVSNEDVPINLTNRRWAVVRAADDPFAPEHTPAHKKYYDRLWDVVPKKGTVPADRMITDEARRVLGYLRTLPLDDFDHLSAPLTGAKQEASESGDDGAVKARVANAYRDKTGPFRFNLLTAEGVAKHVGTGTGRTLTEAMQEIGCRKLRRLDGRDVQVTIDGHRPRMWAINAAVAKHHINTDSDELVRLYNEERAGKPEVEPMAPVDDDFANDPMFAPGSGDAVPPGDWETRH
jgi:hypothetical protein